MAAIFRQELKMNRKGILIWSLSVGILGFICIILYRSMDSEMQTMAEIFSKLGAFSDAFGMSTLSISTPAGFFATEVGTTHGLGSALYAAFFASCVLSKEEEGRTGEFLYSLPVSRGKAVTAKILSLLAGLVIFTGICGAFYAAGFAVLREAIPVRELMRFLGGMLLMNVEISAVSLLISASSGRNRAGAGLGAALVCYAFDLMGRVVSPVKTFLFLGPFSYANAPEIFAGKNAPEYSIPAACIVTAAAAAAAYAVYLRRDLAN